MTGRICGTGSYVPARIVENEELANLVDTNDAWIRERTGIARRHLAEQETTSYMAAMAAKRALAQAGMLAEEVDLILVATSTPETVFPCTACEVQREIQAEHAAGFDLNAACSGFLFALQTAQAYIRAGIYRTALVIGADSMSHVVDWRDRSTCILFGDGAGAVVLRAEEGGDVCPGGTFGWKKRSCADRIQPSQKRLGCSGAGEGRLYSDGWTERI